MNKTARFLRNDDSVAKIIILAFLVIFFVIVRGYPEQSRVFPQVIITAGIILLSFSLLQGIITQFRDVSSTEDVAGGQGDRGRLLKTGLVMVSSLGISALAGILFVVPTVYLGYLILLGKREMTWRVLLVATAATLVTYAIFHSFFGITLINF